MAATATVGTRLRCEECGTEIVVVKVGQDAAPACCGKPLVRKS